MCKVTHSGALLPGDCSASLPGHSSAFFLRNTPTLLLWHLGTGLSGDIGALLLGNIDAGLFWDGGTLLLWHIDAVLSWHSGTLLPRGLLGDVSALLPCGGGALLPGDVGALLGGNISALLLASLAACLPGHGPAVLLSDNLRAGHEHRAADSDWAGHSGRYKDGPGSKVDSTSKVTSEVASNISSQVGI